MNPSFRPEFALSEEATFSRELLQERVNTDPRQGRSAAAVLDGRIRTAWLPTTFQSQPKSDTKLDCLRPSSRSSL